MPGFPTPSPEDVRAAARRIARTVFHTPLVRSAWLSDRSGADVWLKLEFVQPTGSFKIRGALNALRQIADARPGARIVTASAGNHGLGVSWAAATLQLPVRVHLPRTAPDAKRSGIARLGATLVEAESYEAAEASAHADAAESGDTYVSPYSDPAVIAGAGTVALEMIDDAPNLDTIVVPVGGGGLLSGCAIAVSDRQAIQVIGAEACASPAFTSALAAGRIVTVDVHPTIADGLAGNMDPDSATFEIVRQLGATVVAVQESAILDALRGLVEHEHLLVEGAAAAVVGALLTRQLALNGRRVGLVLTGRNVDRDVIRRVLSE